MCPDGGVEESGGEEGKEATVSEGGRRRSGESLGAHEGGTKQRQRDPQRVHSLMPTDTSRLHLLQLQRSSAVTPLRDTRDIWRVFGLKEKQCVSLHLLLLFYSFLFSYFSCVKQDKVSRLWNWLGREGRSWEFWERVREGKKTRVEFFITVSEAAGHHMPTLGCLSDWIFEFVKHCHFFLWGKKELSSSVKWNVEPRVRFFHVCRKSRLFYQLITTFMLGSCLFFFIF